MNILSLFDGISCGQVALERAGIPVTNYYASEVETTAIKVTQKNYPNTIQVGDVTKVRGADLPKINLLMGGSPCQGFSSAGKGLNFDDPRSKLFFEFVRLRDETNPEFWLLENVRMKKEWQDIISELLGVEPIRINSKDFSPQLRDRFYWTNIPVAPWTPNPVSVGSILEQGEHLAKYKVKRTPSRETMWGDGVKGKCVNLSTRQKSCAVTTKNDRWSNAGLVAFEDFCRYLTPIEYERLQTLPDNYTAGISDTKRYHALGNGWTVDVIAHIFKGIKSKELEEAA
jgi:site-specific DNA-cytosine methylase